MDEPNSNLDSAGDDRAEPRHRPVRARGGIAIVIAHRPSALAEVSLILTLGEGEMQAFGPKDEVLRQVLAPPRDRPWPNRKSFTQRDDRMTGTPTQADSWNLRGHIIAGAVLIFLLFGVVGGWAIASDIAGAVVTTGQVVVESNVKKVQHREGGMIAELLVRDGDQVTAGHLCCAWSDTVPRANLEVIRNQVIELTARRLRLEAMRDGQAEICRAGGFQGSGDRGCLRRRAQGGTDPARGPARPAPAEAQAAEGTDGADPARRSRARPPSAPRATRRSS